LPAASAGMVKGAYSDHAFFGQAPIFCIFFAVFSAAWGLVSCTVEDVFIGLKEQLRGEQRPRRVGI